MRLAVLIGLVFITSACAGGRGAMPSDEIRNMQGPQGPLGQYQQPYHMQPTPTQRIPRDDLCRSRLYLGLIGQHEGGIVFSSLPGRTRVVKPAELEIDQDDFLEDMQPQPPYVEIREYLAGQILYAPAIRAVRLGDELGPIEPERLTIELNRNGYISDLSCR